MRLRIVFTLLIALPSFAKPGLYFDDTVPGRLRLGNEYYEITLSKVQGGILGIVDKKANVTLAAISPGGCLWAAAFRDPNVKRDDVSGCSFGGKQPGRFAYAWNESQAALTMTYTADAAAAKRVDAIVTFTLSEEPYLDMRIALENQSDDVVARVTLPSDLRFTAASVQAAYLADTLPGVRLLPEFFKQHRSVTSIYPGRSATMDYLALDVAGGRLALYTVSPSGPVKPAIVGFQDQNARVPGTFTILHGFPNWTPRGHKYTGPILRLRIGQPVRETILAYRAENGIAEYPTIQEKLGARFNKVAQAPLIKAHIDRTFRESARLLDQVEGPAIVHPVAYQAPGFDRGYPDFLPPDPRKGTMADFRAFIEAAHARNLMVMPYINPTWWCDDAPTWKNLPPPLALKDIAVRDLDGQPKFEKYPNGGGWLPSPYVPFVLQRLAKLMAQWRDEVPVDFVFEDQIGARKWLPDLNPASPTPLSYSEGWLAHTAAYAAQGLMTEDGWDRIAKTETGFCGSPLTGGQVFDPQKARWGLEARTSKQLGGPANWEPYPLATWAFHDKVLFYHHDLEMHLTVRTLEVITWNLAFGVSFSYICPGLAGATKPDQIELTNVLQRTFGPKYVGRILTDYTEVAPEVKRSTFEGGLTVIANWNPAAAYTVAGHKIVPSGYFAQTSDHSALAGAFQDVFNNRKLSEGPHHLIVTRTPGVVTVWQPVGADMRLGVDLPADWKAGDSVVVRALDRNGKRLGEAPATIEGAQAVFDYRAKLGGAAVERYEIAAGR